MVGGRKYLFFLVEFSPKNDHFFVNNLNDDFCLQGLKKAKAAVGVGYSNEEIDAEGKADLKVLSDMLADKEYFFGDEPHSLDLVTFAHLAQIINVESGEETGVKCPLKDYLESDCQNLVGLYNRMKVSTMST